MPTASRTIAIGDIHGCDTALATLLAGLALSAADTVVILGDAIDRGPDSRSVLDQLLALSERCDVHCIQGNHEQMLLDALDGRMSVQEWAGSRRRGNARLVRPRAPDWAPSNRGTWNSFGAGGDVVVRPAHFFAHGNYLADRPLDRQPWRDLRWQSLKWHTPSPHVSGATAVVGHTANKQGEVVNLGHLVCIDTYCHGGGLADGLGRGDRPPLASQ